MFKNASIFKITLPQPTLMASMDRITDSVFLPCGPTQERSVGWVPPRGHEHGPLVENIAGQLIMRLMIETKSVPSQAITDAVAAQVKRMEETTGRKPGKKETRELKDDARSALLPHAFPRRVAAWVWIDTDQGMLVIDSASQAVCDEVVTQLVKLMDGVVVSYFDTSISPASLMTGWLLGGDDAFHDQELFGFSVGRACELRASDESKAVVRYTRHGLDTDEVKNHIRSGKSATKLALTYLDRVSFTLTDAGTLAGINILDDVFVQHASKADQESDRFDADVFISTSELKTLIKNLHMALDVVEGGAE